MMPHDMRHGCATDAIRCGHHAGAAGPLSRRAALRGFGAAAAAMCTGAFERPADAETAAVAERLSAPGTDFHHHFFPPSFMSAWNAASQARRSYLLPSVADWTPARSLDAMDRAGIRRAMLSVPLQPFVEDLPRAAVNDLVRSVNEYGHKLVTDHKDRFGLFALLPLPDVDAALAELAVAADQLKADGVGLMTSYGDKWIGDPVFEPLLKELDRRRVVAFVHPRAPVCCVNLMPQISSAYGGLMEFPYDTGRAVMSLLLSGALRRYPNIRWIFCHAGAAIPVLAGRIRTSAPDLVRNLSEIAPQGTDYELQRLYYETANSAYPPTMAALRQYVPASQILFGSDFPYVAVNRNVLDFNALGLSPTEQQAILVDNPRQILARAVR